jgi:hypothetical protein
MSMMKHEVVGWPSVVSDDLLFQSIHQKIHERQSFTISESSWEFSQSSHTVLYEIITVRLGYYKFCKTLVLNIVTGVHKTQRMNSALIF